MKDFQVCVNCKKPNEGPIHTAGQLLGLWVSSSPIYSPWQHAPISREWWSRQVVFSHEEQGTEEESHSGVMDNMRPVNILLTKILRIDFLTKFFFFFLTWLQISCVKIQETLQVSTETEGMVCEQEIHSDGDSLFLIQELWSSVSTGQIISGMLSLVLQAGIGSLALGKQKFNVQEESLRCCVLVCLPFLVIQFP